MAGFTGKNAELLVRLIYKLTEATERQEITWEKKYKDTFKICDDDRRQALQAFSIGVDDDSDGNLVAFTIYVNNNHQTYKPENREFWSDLVKLHTAILTNIDKVNELLQSMIDDLNKL